MRPRTRGRSIAIGLALSGALAVALIANRSARTTAPAAPAVPLAAAPAAGIYDLVLNDADGRPMPLAQWKGRPLVLNFWATWCAPCVAEMPDLDRAQADAGDAIIVGVGTEEVTRVRAFRDRLGLRLPLLAGGYEALVLARNLGDSQGVLPYTVLLSADGQVLRSQTGPLHPGQIRAWLQERH